jgi:hypothetical protein
MAIERLEFLDPAKYYKLRYIGQLLRGNNNEKMIEANFLELANYYEYFVLKNDGRSQSLTGKEVLYNANLRWLPSLRVGSIYQKNKIIKRHNSFGHQAELEIDVSKGNEYLLGDLIDLKDTFYFKLYGQLVSKVWAFQSVKGTNRDGRENRFGLVLIPTYELIRFYYGFTSNLISALFSGGLYRNEIYYPEYSYRYEKDGKEVPFLMLGKKIEDKCAKIVGRIVFDKVAFLNAKRIYDSLLEQNKYNNYPSSGFPFNDTTNLLVSHEWIKVNSGSKIFKRYPGIEKSQWLMLVTEILSCSHVFPFNEIDFLRINDARSIRDRINHPLKLLVREPGKQELDEDTINEDESKPLLEDGEKDPTYPDDWEAVSSEFDPNPGVVVTVNKLEKEDQESMNLIAKTLADDAVMRTRGEGKQKDSKTVGINSELIDQKLDADTENVFNLVVLKMMELGFEVKKFRLNGGNASYSYFPINKLESKHETFDWCFVVKRDIPRKCFLAEFRIKNLDSFFYLIEVQRRVDELGEPTEYFYMFILQKDSNSFITQLELNDFLFHVALNKGVMKPDIRYEGMKLHRIKHLKKDSVDLRVDRILSKINISKNSNLN